ncbi:MAG: beta-ketoacyl synthase N-terminal-like domain-containing protein, partial [Planctomycetota bacterium]
TRDLPQAWITGLGVVLPGVVGRDALAHPHTPRTAPPTAGPVDPDDYLHLLTARRVRRLSDYVKLTLAAAELALRDAGLDAEHRDPFTRDCAAVLGTAHGSTHFSYDYYRGLVDHGLATANPVLFAEGVPNAGAAHLSMSLNIQGPCQSIIGSRTAGLDALRLAALRLAEGQWPRALVCGGEEHDPLVERCYAELGLPLTTAAAAVTFVLETPDAARARGARPLAVVEAGTQIHFNHRPGRGVRGIRRALEHEAAAGVQTLLRSANGTWTDRLEAAALRNTPFAEEPADLGLPHLAECFSAAPLAALAARLAPPPPARPERLSVLATDFNGLTSLARIRVGGDLQ